jgi:hypothetical protein
MRPEIPTKEGWSHSLGAQVYERLGFVAVVVYLEADRHYLGIVYRRDNQIGSTAVFTDKALDVVQSWAMRFIDGCEVTR